MSEKVETTMTPALRLWFSPAIHSGLLGVIDVDGGSTPEQRSVLAALAGLFDRDARASATDALPLDAEDLCRRLTDRSERRMFVQMAIVLELCRHPSTDAQTEVVSRYAKALGIDSPALTIVREAHERSAIEATADFVRFYDGYLPQLSEPSIDSGAERAREDLEVVEAISRMVELPEDTLGDC